MSDEKPINCKPEDRMIYIEGKNFRCDCGCNVFREYEKLKYTCNACNAKYIGE